MTEAKALCSLYCVYSSGNDQGSRRGRVYIGGVWICCRYVMCAFALNGYYRCGLWVNTSPVSTDCIILLQRNECKQTRPLTPAISHKLLCRLLSKTAIQWTLRHHRKNLRLYGTKHMVPKCLRSEVSVHRLTAFGVYMVASSQMWCWRSWKGSEMLHKAYSWLHSAINTFISTYSWN